MAHVRGDKLVLILKDAIKLLAARAAEKSEDYKFNASELHRVTGISRVTIGKYEEEIEQVLEEVKASARIKYGQAHIQQLLNQIDSLESEKKKLKKENDALRIHHADIYSLLYSHSIDSAGLIKTELYKEIEKVGKCILCGAKIENKKTKNNNIVNIKQKLNK